ncbi:MAG TPA: hypothetical protein VK615_01240 [Candidatus Binatia bacterium]|nr:hypothetical protein [Candidatus Binatia bacterium]
MNAKNWIRLFVAAGIIAWPAVELYRLHTTKKELAASEQRLKKVMMAAEAAKLKYAQASPSKN